MTLNEAVRSIRNRLSETQPEFAARLGISLSTLVRYERDGYSIPGGHPLNRLYQLAHDMDLQEELDALDRQCTLTLGWHLKRPQRSSRLDQNRDEWFDRPRTLEESEFVITVLGVLRDPSPEAIRTKTILRAVLANVWQSWTECIPGGSDERNNHEAPDEGR